MASRIFAKSYPTWIPQPDDANIWSRTQGGRDRDTETRWSLQQANPPGADRDLSAGQGRKMGERTGTVNGGRRRHAARGKGTSGGWWVRSTPRWAALSTGRGGGEQVTLEGFDN